MNVIGTCSLCGGAVEVPMHMLNPIPMCRSCGAVPKVPHGPVIEMERPINNLDDIRRLMQEETDRRKNPERRPWPHPWEIPMRSQLVEDVAASRY